MSKNMNAINQFGRELAASRPNSDPQFEVMSVVNPDSVNMEARSARGGSVSIPVTNNTSAFFGQSLVSVRVGNRWAGIGTGGYVF